MPPFSAVMNQLNFKTLVIHEYGLTSLETYLFRPMSLYAGNEGTSVVFNSGRALAVSPFESDFQGSITPMNKQMSGLGATAKVTK